MVAAYFENRRLKLKEIERKNKIMETVIKSLQSVEAAALADNLPPTPALSTFTSESELYDRHAKKYTTKHQKYLAVRLQREKVEQIQKYLATYQSLLHNILSFNLFYSKSYSELTDNLPDPKDNLNGYINTLVDQISKNQADDDFAAQRQLYIGLFLCIITLASIPVLMGTTIGLILMPIGTVFLPLTLTSCIVIWCVQDVKNNRLDLIKNDCVPTINRHSIRLGTRDSELGYSRDILLYRDFYAKKIMCSIEEPTIYKETFELLFINAEQYTALNSAIDSSSPFSDSLKTAVSAAIKTRRFSRVLPDALNNTKQPRSHTVVSDDRLALKSRFFSTEEDNAFNVEAVQNNISDLSS